MRVGVHIEVGRGVSERENHIKFALIQAMYTVDTVHLRSYSHAEGSAEMDAELNNQNKHSNISGMEINKIKMNKNKT